MSLSAERLRRQDSEALFDRVFSDTGQRRAFISFRGLATFHHDLGAVGMSLRRAALVVGAGLALLIAPIWWLITGLLWEDGESACEGELSAAVAFAFSNVGLVLAIVALFTALSASHRRISRTVLAIYASLLVTSVLIYLTCE